MNEPIAVRVSYTPSTPSATINVQYLYKKTGWRWLLAKITGKPIKEWLPENEEVEG